MESVARSRLREKMRIARITQNTPFCLRWQWTLLTSDLSANARLVAMTLRLFGDTEGKGIRPSIETIAAATGLSPRTVQKALTELLNAHFLTGERSAGRTPSRFELALPGTMPTPQLSKSCGVDQLPLFAATPQNSTPQPRKICGEF